MVSNRYLQLASLRLEYTSADLHLIRIHWPGGAAWRFRYDDPDHSGYMSRAILVATDGSERIEQAWSWDPFGNVAATWQGAETLVSYLGRGGQGRVHVVPDWPSNTSGRGANNDLDYSQAGKVKKYPVAPPSPNQSCRFEKCILEAAENLAKGDWTMTNFTVIGPNSNALAYRFVRQCGGRLGVPLSTIGQSGAYGVESLWNITF